MKYLFSTTKLQTSSLQSWKLFILSTCLYYFFTMKSMKYMKKNFMVFMYFMVIISE